MFFDQIKEIDGTIKQLRDDLVGIGKSTDMHFEHLDDIAAHIIALEAIDAAMIKTIDGAVENVRHWVKEMTAESSGNVDGSQKALALVDDIFSED